MATRTRGYLPHMEFDGATYHVVFRLADALPPKERMALTPELGRLEYFESLLDAGLGRRALADPDNADCVLDALHHFNGERYRLEAWCIMPNHVHVVLKACAGYSLAGIVHSWKSFTANAINKRLGASGRFWAREWFDRAMRDEDHLASTIQYVEANPVKASLAVQASDWRWSSAWRE